jgi:putative ABC transport system permease protein
MIWSYLKTSGRNILRNRLFSSINIVGLAISMSVGLLMVAMLSDLLSYDRFHKNGDRIYRVITSRERPGESSREYASTSFRAGKLIRESMPGIEEMTILESGFYDDAHVGDNIVPLKGLWADQSFFTVFSFELVNGNPATALSSPYSLVLTKTAAAKIFRGGDAYGKSVRFRGTDYEVTGVVKDPPAFSHIQFEVLVSLSTKEILEQSNPEWATWTHISSNYVYLVLSENTKTEIMQTVLDELCRKENTPDAPANHLALQPLNGIALGKALANTIGPSLPAVVVWVLGGLALIVILCACFNYTSLSMARSLKRSREIIIRKVVGAGRKHVFGQLITEAVVISLLAMGIGSLLFLFLRPHFLSLDRLLNSMLSLKLSPTLILYFITFAIVTGVVAGFLPAMFFSKINAIQALRNSTLIRPFRHVNIRKGLIVMQFTFSLLFICITILGYRQYRNFVTFDLGFTTKNIINIDLQGNKADLFIKELKEIPEVSLVSRSALICAVGSFAKTPLKYGSPPDSLNVYYNNIDQNYLPLHGFTLIVGRNFSNENNSRNHVLVNEQLLKHFRISPDNPIKAVGEIVHLNGKDREIIGVVKDFHYGGAERLIEPFVFSYAPSEAKFVSARITSGDPLAALASVEAAWRKVDHTHLLQATHYKDQVEESHSGISAILKIIGFLSFLTVSIAALGIFGMTVFTTETRLREISIRKVFGSNELNLIYLLSKGSLIMLTLSALIALPSAYLLFDKLLLPNIAYHVPVAIGDLLAGAVGVTIVVLILIGSQTLKAARCNPAEVLKYE